MMDIKEKNKILSELVEMTSNGIEEWQLWVHPYPEAIKKKEEKAKEKKYRVNSRYIPIRKIFMDHKRRLGERKQTPSQLKRCVLDVAKQYGGDVSKAFAICTAQLQKYGYLEKGTQEPTEKGEKAGRRKRAQGDHSEKVAEYEKLLKKARKSKDD